MSSVLRRVLRAGLRQELPCFVHKAFNTLEPGTAYQHNWHVDHLCWQLARVARGELHRVIFQRPAPLHEVDHHLGRLSGLGLRA